MTRADLYTLPEPQDRWEWIAAAGAEDELPLDPGLGPLFAMLEDPLWLQTPGALPRQVEYTREALVGEGIGRWAGAVGLECLAADPWTFRVEPVEESLSLSPVASGGEVPLECDPEDLHLLAAAQLQPPAPHRAFQVSLRAGYLSTVAGFDQLLCLPLLRQVEHLEHQLKTARTVLRRFRGRALLCDEVGLGKTIEAGMILLELIARGLVQRVLVLTPPSLIEQWKGEMARKLGLDFITHDDPEFKARREEAWSAFPRIIASCHTAKRQPHSSQVLAQEERMRVGELRQRSALRMHLRLLNLLLILYPKFRIQANLALEKGPPVELELVWDPIAGHLEPPPCPSCGRPTLRLEAGRRGGLVCPACAPGQASR